MTRGMAGTLDSERADVAGIVHRMAGVGPAAQAPAVAMMHNHSVTGVDSDASKGNGLLRLHRLRDRAGRACSRGHAERIGLQPTSQALSRRASIAHSAAPANSAPDKAMGRCRNNGLEQRLAAPTTGTINSWRKLIGVLSSTVQVNGRKPKHKGSSKRVSKLDLANIPRRGTVLFGPKARKHIRKAVATHLDNIIRRTQVQDTSMALDPVELNLLNLGSTAMSFPQLPPEIAVVSRGARNRAGLHVVNHILAIRVDMKASTAGQHPVSAHGLDGRHQLGPWDRLLMERQSAIESVLPAARGGPAVNEHTGPTTPSEAGLSPTGPPEPSVNTES